MLKKIKANLKTKFSKELNTLIFFVTTRCNCKCNFCFYWKELNSGVNELSLKEIEEISKKIKFDNLLISGGEPFLRKDLSEIIYLFYRNSKIRSVNIPSNGTLTENIVKTITKILQQNKNLKVSVNLSLDGSEKTHDTLRGVKGTFRKLIKTEKELRKLKKAYPNFNVNITTTVSNKNIDELIKLIRYVNENMDIDYHSFEVIRGDPRDKRVKPPSIQSLSQLYNLVNNKCQQNFIEKLKRNKLKTLNKIQIKTIQGAKWPFYCLAGQSVAVLEPQGNVKPCELYPTIGNIRDYGYDLKRLLNTEKAINIRKKIKSTRCSCTHCVFILESLERSFINYLRFVLLRN